MKRRSSMFGLMTLLSLLGSGLLITAQAQHGGGSGGGGGGSARHGGKYSIIWDAAQPIKGKTPTAVGAVNVSTYITTINLNVRLSSVDLPDKTQLTVTVEAKDYFTGLPWASKTAGTIVLTGQAGSLTVPSLWVTAAGYVPVVTHVVITKADGTVIISGHP